MKEIAVLNPEGVSEEEVRTYPIREAARAIVVDDSGLVALLHVSNKNYYKLPGGGLDDDTDKIVALKRECMEEIGCEVEVLGEVGSLVEYRKFCNLKQISYCYVAKVVGEKGKPDFTESEIGDGFEEVWMSYDDALRALKESKPEGIEGEAYIVPRDTILLETSKNLLPI